MQQQAHRAKAPEGISIVEVSTVGGEPATAAARLPMARESRVAVSIARLYADGVGGLDREFPAPQIVGLEAPPVQLSIDRAIKRVADILGALVLAVVFSPLILVIFASMSRDGKSPIFRHRRVGRDGRLFECLKFRTMVPDAEQKLRQILKDNPALQDEWNRTYKLADDPRVTRLGRFLRRTSLDELPQLWNILRGEMSLVGPRPITREELFRYGRNMLLYTMVKPGITGLWQVSGRSETDYRRRVAIDVCYVRNRGFFLDLWILLKTPLVVLAGKGAC